MYPLSFYMHAFLQSIAFSVVQWFFDFCNQGKYFKNAPQCRKHIYKWKRKHAFNCPWSWVAQKKWFALSLHSPGRLPLLNPKTALIWNCSWNCIYPDLAEKDRIIIMTLVPSVSGISTSLGISSMMMIFFNTFEVSKIFKAAGLLAKKWTRAWNQTTITSKICPKPKSAIHLVRVINFSSRVAFESIFFASYSEVSSFSEFQLIQY